MDRLTQKLERRIGKLLGSRYSKPACQDQGFTLIESLVAIVVISVLIVGIAPTLALTVASRVQARRVDLATQAARAYIDGVRGAAVPIPQNFVNSVLVSGRPKKLTDSDFPASLMTISYPFSTVDPGIRVDTNNNGFSVNDPQDLILMPVRNNGSNGTAPYNTGPDGSTADITRLQKQGFELVVRVYRADAFSGSTPPTQVVEAKSIFTSTNGSRNYPLVVMRAEVLPSQFTLTDMKNRIAPLP
jgi:prepilin-type N-terminal cleavage/methylation domain-containing protein